MHLLTTAGFAIAARKTKRPMRPKPLIPMRHTILEADERLYKSVKKCKYPVQKRSTFTEVCIRCQLLPVNPTGAGRATKGGDEWGRCAKHIMPAAATHCCYSLFRFANSQNHL